MKHLSEKEKRKKTIKEKRKKGNIQGV